MEYQAADWSGIGILLLLFVILPSIGRQVRWGGRGTWWDHRPFSRRDGQPAHRELEALRAELDDKAAEVDLLSARVSELENRLDFAERLLTQPDGTRGRPDPIQTP
ncbi:MAG: hypothetical protein FJ206_01860 [Gemmatimonadetes bacterium]|nr:hypothetical protein [Gemmatimonadota bacterium]